MTSGYVASFEPVMRLALDEAASCAAEHDAGAGAGGGPTGGLAGVAASGSGGHDADVPVGAIVLDPAGAVIGRGRNRREADGDPTAHAEIVAIRSAARALGRWRLDGCTLVVTLEPCTMCAGAVTSARLGRLIYGAADARAGAAGSLWDVVRDRRLGQDVEVIGGVLAQECAELLREFFGRRR